MVKKHLHTYRKTKTPNGNDKFQCTDSKCTHFVIGRSSVLGKSARCGRCTREFIIDQDSLRRVKLPCQFCMGTALEGKNNVDLTELERKLRESLAEGSLTSMSELEEGAN